MSGSLIILIPYFGRWPDWMNFFVESCKWNPDVRWRFYTDCGTPENEAGNVSYVHTSFRDYKAHVSARLGINFDSQEPYKLCDVRPCIGHIHEEDVRGFDFWGYADIDTIFGDIAAIYTPDVLSRFDVLSTHPERLSGHFAVLRNTQALRQSFMSIQNYRSLLERPQYVGMDEGEFTTALRQSQHSLLFVERHSTVLSPRGWHDGTMDYPEKWFWRRGHLTNERDGEREFLYIHFMRWQSDRWASDPPARGEGAWMRLPRIIQLDWRRAAADGFCIGVDGFTSVATPSSWRAKT